MVLTLILSFFQHQVFTKFFKILKMFSIKQLTEDSYPVAVIVKKSSKKLKKQFSTQNQREHSRDRRFRLKSKLSITSKKIMM
jgi:hypothetical protein